MIYFMIALFSIVVWLAKGHYDPSVPVLVVAFLSWSFLTVFRPRKTEDLPLFYRFYPWFSALLMAIKPNLIYVSEALRPVYSVYRFLPLGFTALPKKVVPILFLLFFMAVIYLSPNPFIDVFRNNTMGVEFFLNGLNPYSQAYPDIYGGHFDYHPGFLYWPMALYLQTLSKIIFGDIRAVLILAWWGAAFLIPVNHFRSSELKKIWWLIPFVAFGLEQAWLDPLLSATAMATLWSLKNRRWKYAALSIAIAASIKQYGFIIGLFPCIYLLLEREWKNLKMVVIRAGALFFMVLSPFLVWNFQDFFTMTIGAHTNALARPDALNFTAMWMKYTGMDFPEMAQLMMTAFGFGLATFHIYRNRKMRKLAVIPESWAIAFGFSMMFGKFAFCNYHWLLISFWLMILSFEDAGTTQS